MKDETLFFHGTSKDGRRFTLAAKIDSEEDMIIGIAICSETDQFVKKIGRNKAEGRLNSDSFRGSLLTSLYSDRLFSAYKTGLGGFPEHYFIGKELEIFLHVCHNFEKLTFKELKYEFNLPQ